ncbi:MAG: hypothetical protein MJA30_11005, partial [Cytophagales bacterium]|nr:hypothetical protein [Cytophagales bacterium]
CGSKPGFHFLLPAHAIGIPSGKESEPKEKGASDKAHFPLETHYPAATGLKCAHTVPVCSPPCAIWIFNGPKYIGVKERQGISWIGTVYLLLYAFYDLSILS